MNTTNDELRPYHLDSCASKKAWTPSQAKSALCTCGLTKYIYEQRIDECYVLANMVGAQRNYDPKLNSGLKVEAVPYDMAILSKRIAELTQQLGGE
jgi:hypothetical protein